VGLTKTNGWVILFLGGFVAVAGLLLTDHQPNWTFVISGLVLASAGLLRIRRREVAAVDTEPVANTQTDWDRLRPDVPTLDQARRPSWALIRWLAPSWLAVAVPGVLCLAFGIAGITGAAPLETVFLLLPGAFFSYLAFGVACFVFTNKAPGAKGFDRIGRFLQRDVRHPGADD
jgi:hypothetical protein